MFFRARLACSLCRKGAAEVSQLVAAPRVSIREACVAIARRIMNSSDEDPTAQAHLPSHPVRRALEIDSYASSFRDSRIARTLRAQRPRRLNKMRRIPHRLFVILGRASRSLGDHQNEDPDCRPTHCYLWIGALA